MLVCQQALIVLTAMAPPFWVFSRSWITAALQRINAEDQCQLFKLHLGQLGLLRM
jgi:hypothetical protein